jgi:formate transporter
MTEPTVVPPEVMRFDALLPPEMARRAEDAGVAKAALDAPRLFVLAVLAGAFVALGAVTSTVALAGASGALPYGVARLIGGVAFSLGLVLVIVGGAELFTGNNLIVMAWASRRVSLRALLRNWVVVYAGNFAGAVATAGLVFASGHYGAGGGAVGATALSIAASKTSLGFGQAIALGVLCNALVCLAVWLCFSARSTADRILAIVPPITAFVAAGFEHSIANMYFVPIAIFVRAGAPDAFWASIGKSAADYPTIGWEQFLLGNLVPVTIGNVVGGTILVGAVYAFVYRRRLATSRALSPGP